MKKTLMALVVIFIVGAVAYAQNIDMMSGQGSRYCRSRGQHIGLSMMGGGMMGPWMMSMVRHRYFMMYGIPLQYRNLRNPVQATEENIKEGGRLYSAQCALCHGSRGYGDGLGGKNLYPPPANISLAVRMPISHRFLFVLDDLGRRESSSNCYACFQRSSLTFSDMEDYFIPESGASRHMNIQF